MEMFKTAVTVTSALVAVLLHIPLMAVGLTLLWNWFVVPVGMKPTNFVNAMGILLLVSLLVNARKLSEAEGEFSYREVVQLVSLPLIYIAVGFGLKLLK